MPNAFVRLGPLLAKPRPTLRRLTVNNGIVSTEELEDLLASGKEALPNLYSLSLTTSSLSEGSDPFDEDRPVPDWSCLYEIDFPNLVHLKLKCLFKDLLRLGQPTAKLPKLESLDVLCTNSSPLQNSVEEILDYSDRVFSCPIIHQLTSLHIRSYYFRLGSLAVLCSYGPEMKNLKYLLVHSRGFGAVDMIAKCGKNGGFPSLVQIEFYDMDPDLTTYKSIHGESFQQMVRNCLRRSWPTIRSECHFSTSFDHNYGQPNEFYDFSEDTSSSEDLLDSDEDAFVEYDPLVHPAFDTGP